VCGIGSMVALVLTQRGFLKGKSSSSRKATLDFSTTDDSLMDSWVFSLSSVILL